MEAKRQSSGSSLQIFTIQDHGSSKTNRNSKLTPMEELEIALDECKFGMFYIRFFIAILFSTVSSVLVSANTAYLLPNAECDLKMSIYQKGVLNAMCYMGMLTGGLFAGFLTDAFGRKMFLVYGYLGISLCCVIEGSSQNYDTLLVGKFLEGLVSSAAINALVTIPSEMTSRKNRDVMMLVAFSFNALANILIALFSWSILPQQWKFEFLDGRFVLNSWNIYLYACGMFSLVAFLMHLTLPESPKFLVAHQRYKEALHIVRKIYSENTRKKMDTFPIKSIGASAAIPNSPSTNSIKDKTFYKIIMASLHDVKPLFRRPMAIYLLLFCSIQFMIMLVYNVLRLWYPQLSTIIEHYNKEHKRPDDLCVMLDAYMLANAEVRVRNVTEDCVSNVSGRETYINSIIMGCTCIVPYILSATLIPRVGKRMILLVALGVGCSCVTSLGWAETSVQVVALVSTTVALTQICQSLFQTIAANTFPTVFRSLSVSMTYMAGRIGTLTGNIMFPILLAQGCLIPFFTIAGFLICVMLLSLLLPSLSLAPHKKVQLHQTTNQ